MSRGLTVQDRLLTLDKTMATTALKARVLPVLAGWGYNTKEQQDVAAAAPAMQLVMQAGAFADMVAVADMHSEPHPLF